MFRPSWRRLIVFFKLCGVGTLFQGEVEELSGALIMIGLGVLLVVGVRKVRVSKCLQLFDETVSGGSGASFDFSDSGAVFVDVPDDQVDRGSRALRAGYYSVFSCFEYVGDCRKCRLLGLDHPGYHYL